MRMTLVVRNPETQKVFTHVSEFAGENAYERILAAINTLFESWVIKGKQELIVLHVSPRI